MKKLIITCRTKATIFFSNFILMILAYVRSIYIVSLLLGLGFIIYPSFWHIVTDMFELDLFNLDTDSIRTVNHINCDGPAKAGAQDVQHSQDVLLTESQTDDDIKAVYKNPYVIGAAIALVAICLVLWFYYPSLPDDSASDTDSIISTGTSTVIGTDWASVSSVFYNEASPSTSHIYLNARMFRQALDNHEISHYLASLGHYHSIDLVLLNFLREQAEANIIDFTLITENGGVPLRIFDNEINRVLYEGFWRPSELYPTYQSFVTDFFLKYFYEPCFLTANDVIFSNAFNHVFSVYVKVKYKNIGIIVNRLFTEV
jgi:hypothetical protein